MTDRDEHLQQTLTALRARWGAAIIRRLGEQQADAFPTISTGFPALDTALEIGGLPQGRMIEFSGRATSGITTLAWHTMAQIAHGPIIYLDPQKTFDPVTAIGCGVDLSRLLLAHPQQLNHALQLTRDVVLVYGDMIPLLVMDLPGAWLAPPVAAVQIGTILSRLIAPLSRYRCTLLILVTWPAAVDPLLTENDKCSDKNEPGAGGPHNDDSPLAQYAALRLRARRTRWRYRRRDVAAYDIQIEIVKNKLGAAPRQLTLTIVPERDLTLAASQ